MILAKALNMKKVYTKMVPELYQNIKFDTKSQERNFLRSLVRIVLEEPSILMRTLHSNATEKWSAKIWGGRVPFLKRGCHNQRLSPRCPTVLVWEGIAHKELLCLKQQIVLSNQAFYHHVLELLQVLFEIDQIFWFCGWILHLYRLPFHIALLVKDFWPNTACFLVFWT